MSRTTRARSTSCRARTGSRGQRRATEPDVDRDGTQFDWHAPNPAFNVHPDGHSVDGWDWTPDSSVTVFVGPLGAPLGQTTAVTDAGGNFQIDNWEAVDFDPGTDVTVEDGSITKWTVVAPLAVTGWDTTADTVSGICTPDTDPDRASPGRLWAVLPARARC